MADAEQLRMVALEPDFSVCKVEDYSRLDLGQPFVFTGSTDEEKSLVSPTAIVPQNTVERDDGSWLLSGSMPADEMADKIGIVLPQNRSYETAAGFVLAELQHIPKTGEHVDVNGWRFEVVDLDGRRIDKILASRHLKVRRQLL